MYYILGVWEMSPRLYFIESSQQLYGISTTTIPQWQMTQRIKEAQIQEHQVRQYIIAIINMASGARAQFPASLHAGCVAECVNLDKSFHLCASVIWRLLTWSFRVLQIVTATSLALCNCLLNKKRHTCSLTVTGCCPSQRSLLILWMAMPFYLPHSAQRWIKTAQYKAHMW